MTHSNLLLGFVPSKSEKAGPFCFYTNSVILLHCAILKTRKLHWLDKKYERKYEDLEFQQAIVTLRRMAEYRFSNVYN